MSNEVKIAVVIDEEPHFSDIMASTLRMADFEVYQFYEATGAMNTMLSKPEVFSRALMLIDMALEPGADEKRFSNEETDNYMTTGLVLADVLLAEGLVENRRRANVVLYSAHQLGQFWSKIDRFCEEFGTRKWQKRADADLSEILDLAAEYVT